MSRAVTLGGCVVHLCTEPQVLDHVKDALRDPSAGTLAVASANLDHLHHFGSGRPFEGRLQPRAESGLQWMTLLDGFPLVRRVNHITGEEWPRLSGSDLIDPILALAEKEEYRVGFLGGTTENHERVQKTLSTKHPIIKITGFWAPTRTEIVNPASSAELAKKIRDAGVDILFVALGKPRQEEWIADFGVLSSAKVLLAFGAATDFMTGQSRRAPRWMQDNGLEWAHRLSKEPRRLGKRYLLEGPGAALLLMSKTSTKATAPAKVSPAKERCIQTLGCLVVTHNSQHHIRALLSSIPNAAAGLDVQVVVVDNSSEDATIEILSDFPNIKVVSSGGNIGYAGGINVGLGHLSRADAIAILNPDLTLANGSLSALVNGLKDLHVGVTVPLIETPRGGRYDSLRREPTLIGALGEAALGSRYAYRPLRFCDTLRRPQHYGRVRDVDWASGAAWLVAADCLTEVGEWNETYFLYSEETEYARRVRQAGYRIRFIPSARVVHTEGGSSQSPQLATLLAVNRIRDYESCHSPFSAQLFRLVILLHHALRVRQKKHRRVLYDLVRLRPDRLPRATRN